LQFGGLRALFGGDMPTKAPRDDGTAMWPAGRIFKACEFCWQCFMYVLQQVILIGYVSTGNRVRATSFNKNVQYQRR